MRWAMARTTKKNNIDGKIGPYVKGETRDIIDECIQEYKKAGYKYSSGDVINAWAKYGGLDIIKEHIEKLNSI